MTVFIIFAVTALIICGLLVVFYTIMMFKNDSCLKNRMIIMNAIHDYCMYQLANNIIAANVVSYCDMEDYDKTLKRFWDWGYTRILPHDKFMLIRPFILEEYK